MEKFISPKKEPMPEAYQQTMQNLIPQPLHQPVQQPVQHSMHVSPNMIQHLQPPMIAVPQLMNVQQQMALPQTQMMQHQYLSPQPQFISPQPQQPQFVAPQPQQPQFVAPQPQQPQFVAPQLQQPQYVAPQYQQVLYNTMITLQVLQLQQLRQLQELQNQFALLQAQEQICVIQQQAVLPPPPPPQLVPTINPLWNDSPNNILEQRGWGDDESDEQIPSTSQHFALIKKEPGLDIPQEQQQVQIPKFISPKKEPMPESYQQTMQNLIQQPLNEQLLEFVPIIEPEYNQDSDCDEYIDVVTVDNDETPNECFVDDYNYEASENFKINTENIRDEERLSENDEEPEYMECDPKWKSPSLIQMHMNNSRMMTHVQQDADFRNSPYKKKPFNPRNHRLPVGYSLNGCSKKGTKNVAQYLNQKRREKHDRKLARRREFERKALEAKKKAEEERERIAKMEELRIYRKQLGDRKQELLTMLKDSLHQEQAYKQIIEDEKKKMEIIEIFRNDETTVDQSSSKTLIQKGKSGESIEKFRNLFYAQLPSMLEEKRQAVIEADMMLRSTEGAIVHKIMHNGKAKMTEEELIKTVNDMKAEDDEINVEATIRYLRRITKIIPPPKEGEMDWKQRTILHEKSLRDWHEAYQNRKNGSKNALLLHTAATNDRLSDGELQLSQRDILNLAINVFEKPSERVMESFVVFENFQGVKKTPMKERYFVMTNFNVYVLKYTEVERPTDTESPASPVPGEYEPVFKIAHDKIKNIEMSIDNLSFNLISDESGFIVYDKKELPRTSYVASTCSFDAGVRLLNAVIQATNFDTTEVLYPKVAREFGSAEIWASFLCYWGEKSLDANEQQPVVKKSRSDLISNDITNKGGPTIFTPNLNIVTNDGFAVVQEGEKFWNDGFIRFIHKLNASNMKQCIVVYPDNVELLGNKYPALCIETKKNTMNYFFVRFFSELDRFVAIVKEKFEHVPVVIMDDKFAKDGIGKIVHDMCCGVEILWITH